MTEQEVREHIGGLAGDFKCYNPLISHEESLILYDMINKPEPHWIPVTENCDCDLMDNEEVLVFQKDGTINGQIRHAMFSDFNGKKKFVTWEEGITIYHVVAYMPLPEPYKGGDGMSEELKRCPFRIHGERTASLTVAGEFFYNETFMPCMGKECACFKEDSVDAYCDRNGAFMTMTKEVTE